MTIALSTAGVGVLCVLGAFLALNDHNTFAAVILCVLAIAAAGVCLAIIYKNVKSLR